MSAAFRRTLALSFSRVHDWLPPPSGVSYGLDNLVTTFTKAGISRVAFLRHGNAPSLKDGIDFDRQLTERGKGQALDSGISFGRDLAPYYESVLVSPSPRTVDTAHIFLDAAAILDTKIQREPILYDGTMQPGGSVLFKKIGYVTLREYINNSNDQDRDLSRLLVGGYTHEVLHTMMKTVLSKAPQSETSHSRIRPPHQSTLLMVGHALYLPAVTLGLASLVGCDQAYQDLILDDKTNEAEGYLVELSVPSVSLLQRPKSV
jgi:hypothetical protein